SVRAECERVFQVVRIVPLRKVGAAVRAPGLAAIPRAVRDRQRNVEHEVQLEDGRQFRIKDAILVREPHRGESVPHLAQHAAGVREGGLLSEYPYVALHELLHLDPQTRDGLLRALPAQDRKSTRLNSSHEWISYAVFCLKK